MMHHSRFHAIRGYTGKVGRLVAVVGVAAVFGALSGACAGSTVAPSPTPAASATPPVEETVRTKRLEIVDGSGITRVLITTLADGRPSLTFVDQKGRDRAWLFLGQDGAPNLVLIDNPRTALLDGNGEIRSAQYIDQDGSVILSFMDTSGKLRGKISVGPDGSPHVQLLDANGAPVFLAPGTP